MRRLLVVVVVAEHKTLETILALKLRRPGTSAWRQILSACVWSKWCCNHFASRRRSVFVVVVFASKAKHFALKKMCVCVCVSAYLSPWVQLSVAERAAIMTSLTLSAVFWAISPFCGHFWVFFVVLSQFSGTRFLGIFSRRKLNFKSGFSCFCRTKRLFFFVKTDPFYHHRKILCSFAFCLFS